MIKYQEVGIVPFKCSDIDDNEEEVSVDFSKVNLDEYYTTKINRFLRTLKEGNRKCVVWCLFVDSINLITNILQKKDIKLSNIWKCSSR